MKFFRRLSLFAIAAFFVLSVSGSALGQTLYDSFSDGDYTANPTWTGTAGWTVVANSDAAAGATGSNTLRLNAAAVTATDYLSSQVASFGTSQEWGFFMGRRGQAFTGSNQQYFWLYANEANLTSATVDGYRIAIGDDSGGDNLRLEYIVNGAVNTTVITSTGSTANSITDIGFLVRVTRSNTGAWEIFTSALPQTSGTGAIATDVPSAANTPTSQGTGTNNSLVPADNGYIGVAALHTTGSASIVTAEFDQIYLTFASAPTPANFTINDVTLAEGDAGTTSFTFTVTRSNDVGTSTVDYATADGTATAGSDYTTTSGTLTFNPGQTTQQITVLVSGDTTTEPDETFFVNLSNASNANITDAQGVGTILNDETGSTGTIPPGTYTNLNVESGTLGGNVTVTGTLTIGGGVITTGANTLTLGQNGTYTRGAGFVEGNFQKVFPTLTEAGTFEFPVGTTAGPHDGYTPVLLSSITSTAGDALTVSAIDDYLPGLWTQQSATRRWQLTESGSGNLRGVLRFTYLDGDVVGDETTYKLYKIEMGSLMQVAASVDTVGNTIQSLAQVDNFSPWGIGNQPTAAFASISGRINTPADRLQSRIMVTLTDVTGQSRTILAGKTGGYRFREVMVGETYILTVQAKGYSFTPKVITVTEDMTEVNFEPNE